MNCQVPSLKSLSSVQKTNNQSVDNYEMYHGFKTPRPRQMTLQPKAGKRFPSLGLPKRRMIGLIGPRVSPPPMEPSYKSSPPSKFRIHSAKEPQNCLVIEFFETEGKNFEGGLSLRLYAPFKSKCMRSRFLMTYYRL